EHRRHPAEHVLASHRGRQQVEVVDAVEERDDRSVRPDERRKFADGCLGVVRLHAEEDDVAGPDLPRIVRRLGAAHELALRAAHLQAVLPDPREMRATGEERDVGSGLRKPSAEEPSDAPGADDSDAHQTTLAISSSDSGFSTVDKSPGSSPRARARTARRTIFALRVFGSADTKSTRSGANALPSSAETAAATSSADVSAPAASTQNTHETSPFTSWGTPIAAASATAG